MASSVCFIAVFVLCYFVNPAFTACRDHNNTAVDTKDDCATDRDEFCYYCKVNSTSYCFVRNEGCGPVKDRESAKCDPFGCADPEINAGAVVIGVIVLVIICCVIPGIIIFCCIRYCRRKRARQDAAVSIQTPEYAPPQHPLYYGAQAADVPPPAALAAPMYPPPPGVYPNQAVVYPNQVGGPPAAYAASAGEARPPTGAYPGSSYPSPAAAASPVPPQRSSSFGGEKGDDFYWHPSWGPRPDSLGSGPTPKLVKEDAPLPVPLSASSSFPTTPSAAYPAAVPVSSSSALVAESTPVSSEAATPMESGSSQPAAVPYVEGASEADVVPLDPVPAEARGRINNDVVL